jgi:hypothetical protein
MKLTPMAAGMTLPAPSQPVLLRKAVACEVEAMLLDGHARLLQCTVRPTCAHACWSHDDSSLLLHECQVPLLILPTGECS